MRRRQGEDLGGGCARGKVCLGVFVLLDCHGGLGYGH